MPRKIGADAWFDRWEAQKYEVQEQTIRTTTDEVLRTLIAGRAASDVIVLQDD